MNYRMTKKDAVQQFRWDWSDFLNDAMDYWGDHFDDVVDEISEYANCDFKKDRKNDTFIDINNTGGKY